MTDHDALVRAICEHPDEDTPRLIYADFLDESGEPDRAAFVRAQVELARTPPWEPFAAFCRHRRPEWDDGQPFRRSLPPLPAGWNVEWHDRAFRRGLGWRVVVKSLGHWDEIAPRLVEQAPVGEFHLPAGATLDHWRQSLAADWARRVRVVHLEGGSPTERVRALRTSPAVTGVTDVHFHQSTIPGLSFVVSDLLKSRVGGSIRGLHFRLGFEALEDLIDALTHDGAGVERLTLDTMGLTAGLVRRWCDRGRPAGLTELDLKDNYTLGNEGVRALADGLAVLGRSLRVLGLARATLTADGAEALAGCQGLTGVRVLDLSRNPLGAAGVWHLARSGPLAGVRVLNLARCQLGDTAVRRLVRARFWPGLVELDLRDNPITDPGARRLANAPVPPDLTAILLDGSRLGHEARAALRRHFGDRVILEGG